MEPKNNQDNTKEIPSFFFEKYWEIYRYTDEKRVKAFFYLISLITLLVLFIIGDENSVKFLGTDIKVDNAIVVFPLIIFILALRYFILSSLAFGNHRKFNGYLEEYKSSVDLNTSHFKKFSAENFKSDDINEFPNMFLIPVQIDKSNKIKMYKWIRKLLEWCVTLLFGIFHLSAILLFIYLYFFTIKQKTYGSS